MQFPFGFQEETVCLATDHEFLRSKKDLASTITGGRDGSVYGSF